MTRLLTFAELDRLMRERPRPGRAGITPEEALAERLEVLAGRIEALERCIRRVEVQQQAILEALLHMRRLPRVAPPQPRQQRLRLGGGAG